MRKLLVIGMFVVGVVGLLAQENDSITFLQHLKNVYENNPSGLDDDVHKLDKKKMSGLDYLPEFHGIVRAKYEYQPFVNLHRFQVRNARLNIKGNVHPIVGYRIEADFSDRGEMRVTNAYAKVFPVKGLEITLGQMKIPFSTDNMRSPQHFFFSNRAFIAKQFTGHRDVGLTLGYELDTVFPFEVVAGVFNGSGLTNQKEWRTGMNYSARIQFKPIKYFNFAFNYHSLQPDSMRMNMFDVELISKFHNFHIEVEGLYKTYQDNLFAPSYGLTAFANYDIFLPKVFDRIALGVRYDYMSENNRGGIDTDTGKYLVDDVERHRFTAGVTLGIAKPFVADLRLNYEKYFYQDGFVPGVQSEEQDKICVELVVSF